MKKFKKVRGIAKFSFKWGLRGFTVISLALLILVPTYIMVINHLGEKTAQELIKEIASVDALPKRPPEIDVHDNGANLIQAAAMAVEHPQEIGDDMPIFGSNADWPEFGKGMTAEQTAILDIMVERNTLSYALLDKGLNKPAHYYDAGTITLDFTTLLPTLGQLRHLARWQIIRGLHAQAHGDIETAADAVIKCLAIGQTLAQNNLLITELVRTSISALGVGHLESAMGRLEFSEPILYSFADVLDNEAKSYNLAETYKKELSYTVFNIANPATAAIIEEQAGFLQAQSYFHLYQAYDNYDTSQDLKSYQLDYLLGSEQATWNNLSNKLSKIYHTLCPGHYQIRAK